MNETIIIAKWLLVFSLTGFVGSMIFVKEDSKMLRYTVGKALGIVILAAITWLLSLLHILPFSSYSVWAVLIVMYGLTLYFRQKFILKFIKQNYRQMLVIESLVLGIFLILISLRMQAPKIEGIEKFMDMAILTGLMRHKTGIPLDTWYAPNGINYYYFGHWIVACWAKLSFVGANYAFNLGFASVLSVVASMIYAIVQKLSGKIWAGFLGIFLALFASNVYSFIVYVSNTEAIDFFKSGRFVEEVINEYPLYSIYLGDLHAHMLGLILSVATFGILVITADITNKKPKLDYAIIGILLGLMALTNSFDIINCGVLLAFYFLWQYFIRKTDIKNIVKSAWLLVLGFSTIFIISMLTFKPAVSGIQLAIFKTPLLHIFWQFGAVLGLILACLVLILTQPKPKLFIKKYIKSYQFMIMIFAVSAITLVAITELIYFKDIYHYANPPYARANTQFKIWYSAWIMLAIAAASLYGLAFGYSKRTSYKVSLIIIGLLTVGITAVGTITGYRYTRHLNQGQSQALDGTNYLQPTHADKLAVIKYVNQYVSGQPIILQNGGDSYSQNSWLSSYTGTASYLGWRSHEWGWRYASDAWDKISIKDNAIKQAYEATTSQELTKSLQNIGAKYVLVGPDETSTYNINKQLFEETLGKPVFSSGDYALYKVMNL